MVGEDGLGFQPIRIGASTTPPFFAPPGVQYGAFAIPTGPFATDPASDESPIYVFYTQPTNGDPAQVGPNILARSDDGTKTFHFVYYFPFPDFYNVSSVVVDTGVVPGLPSSTGKGLLVFGTGTYRQSNVYLAFCSVDDLEALDQNEATGEAGTLPSDQWFFFLGLAADGAPIWSAQNVDAPAPLFEEPFNGEPGIGEFSVAFEPQTGLWLMLYKFQTGNVEARYAPNPWGPWDAPGLPEVIFDPFDPSYYVFGQGGFLHNKGGPDTLNQIPGACPSACGVWCSDDEGAVYGPYMVPSWFKVNPGSLTIYYTLSTWRPYQVVLMKSEFKITCASS
jgi:hypothetical protein